MLPANISRRRHRGAGGRLAAAAPHLLQVFQLRQRAAQVRQLLAAAAALVVVRQRKLAARRLPQALLLEAQQRLLVGRQALVVL